MFVQIIEGQTSDGGGLKRQGEQWQTELRPGAAGFLGVTSGSAADGRSITIARFESEEVAQANGARPEQGAWWSETEKYYDGDVTFTDSTDVTEVLGGGSNEAGFVQIMKVSGVDRVQIERLDTSLEEFASHRPDLIGGLRVWTGPDQYIEAAYFTSEAEARAGEQTEMPAEVQEMIAELQELTTKTEFIDLTEPQLY